MHLSDPGSGAVPPNEGQWTDEDLPLVLAILKSANMTFWAGSGADDNFAIRLWGDGAERIYGHSRHEALGKSYIDLFVNPRERERAIEDHARIVATGEVYDWDWAADDVTATGDVRTMLTHCFRVQDPSDGSWLLAEVGIDVSDLNRASQQLRKVREDEFQRQEMTLARAIGQIGQAVAEVGREGTLGLVGDAVVAAVRDAVRGTNRVAVNLENDPSHIFIGEAAIDQLKDFPFHEEQAFSAAVELGKPIYSNPPEPGGISAKLARTERRSRQRSFALLPLRGIQTRPLGVIAVALTSGRSINKLERERLETIAAFAGPLISVAQELESFRDEEAARLLSEQKKIVFQSVLHKVGNEVYTLRGYTDQLADVMDDASLSPHVSQLLQQILSQSDQLNSALEGLRNELESDDRVESINLSTALNAIVIPLRGRYPLIQFTIDIDPSHNALIVQSWLDHIVQNVVVNAVQILNESDGGGMVTLSSQARRDGVLELHIQDSGPGVDPDIRESLFEKGVSHRSGGTGRGLHIARDLVQRAGGTISLVPTASEHGGAHFRIDLRSGDA